MLVDSASGSHGYPPKARAIPLRPTSGVHPGHGGLHHLGSDQENEAAMPRPSKGARLYKRRARYADGKLVHQAVWIIKDGDRHIATGCVASPSETKPPTEAEQALADHIVRKYQPERRRQDVEDIDCADVLSIYLTDIGASRATNSRSKPGSNGSTSSGAARNCRR